MRKSLICWVVSISLLLPNFPVNAANPKAGTSCPKAGLVQNFSNKKFTCIKVGNKLLWNKGITISNGKSIPKPTVSATANSSSKTEELDNDGYPKNVPAPNRTCPNEGQTASLKDIYLKCVSGHWKIETKTSQSTPAPSFTPMPLQPNNPKDLSSNSPAPGRFCLDSNSQSAYGNEYLVCKSGVWTRQLGYRIQTSKTPAVSYIPKNSKTTEREIENALLSNWAEWKKKKLKNTPNMKIVVQDGYSKDWEEITRETITYVNNVLDGNGLKIVQTPQWLFGETEEFRVKNFNEYAPTSPCNPPYIPNQEELIYCATFDMGSGGLRIGRPGFSVLNNYRLTTKDKKLLAFFVAHDMGIFYVVQTQYGDVAYTGKKNQIPAWIREGSAQIIGLLATNDLYNSGKSYIDLDAESLMVGPKPESICSKDLQDAEGREKIMPDSCSSSQHFYAVSLLVAKYGGLEALFKFHRLYGLNDDWVNDFKESFGITREDFYREWWSYLGIPQSAWPDLQPPTPPERY